VAERPSAYTPIAAHLPGAYQQDADSYEQVSGYLGLVDELLRGAAAQLDDLLLWLSPDMRSLRPPGLAPDAQVGEIYARYRALADELASWFGYRFPGSWERRDDPDAELNRKRAFLQRAARLWRRRGTPRGFYAWLVFAFDLWDPQARPIMIEHFRYRDDDSAGAAEGDEDDFAHRVTLLVPLGDRFPDMRRRRELADWVERQAPAHLQVRVCWLAPGDPRYTGFDPTKPDDVRTLLRTIASYTPLEEGIHLEAPPIEGRAQDSLGLATLPGPARRTDTEET
jgi:hypothetical protein